MEVGMELPGILKQIFTGHNQGFIELCPDEYDMENLSDLIESTLAECEELTIGPNGVSVPSDGNL